MENNTWIYGPGGESKIVPASEAEAYYTQGWVDSPAKLKPESGKTPEPSNTELEKTRSERDAAVKRCDDALELLDKYEKETEKLQARIKELEAQIEKKKK